MGDVSGEVRSFLDHKHWQHWGRHSASSSSWCQHQSHQLCVSSQSDGASHLLSWVSSTKLPFFRKWLFVSGWRYFIRDKYSPVVRCWQRWNGGTRYNISWMWYKGKVNCRWNTSVTVMGGSGNSLWQLEVIHCNIENKGWRGDMKSMKHQMN